MHVKDSADLKVTALTGDGTRVLKIVLFWLTPTFIFVKQSPLDQKTISELIIFPSNQIVSQLFILFKQMHIVTRTI